MTSDRVILHQRIIKEEIDDLISHLNSKADRRLRVRRHCMIAGLMS